MTAPALFRLPPTRADLAVARAIANHVTPRLEHATQPLTWLADETLVLALVAGVWLHARLAPRDLAARRRADRLLGAVIAAGAVPHLVKHLVDRKRPDRTVVHLRRHGVPRSGNPWDSFPSGHAVHLGAAAPMLRHLAPPGLRPFVWPAAAALAATRLLLLAHYPTDVATGLAGGVLLDRAVGWLLGRVRALNSAAPRTVADSQPFEEKA